jgi:Fic family protein
MSPEQLARMRDSARVQSVASSCRIAGIRASEADVVAVLTGMPSPVPESDELSGYAAAMDRSFPSSGPIVTLDELAALNAVVVGKPGNPPPPSALRETPLHLEVFDAEGRALGRVLQTLPPRLLQDKIEDLVSWLELELRGGEQHALLVAGTFFIYFTSISPFERGNGRTARVILPHLIRRAGYAFVDYGSLERVFDELRFAYYDAIDEAETKIWTDEADLTPWMSFFIESLKALTMRLQAKIDLESRARELPPLQRAILDTIRENGTGAASLLMAKTGANRNTLKDNLRRLVDRGLLERSGSKRGTIYRLSVGDPQDVQG